MRRRICRYIWLACWLIVLAAVPMAGQELKEDILRQQRLLERDSMNVEALKEACFLYLKSSDYDQAIRLGNVSGVYYPKKDAVGLNYSLEAYELGHEQDSPHLILWVPSQLPICTI